MSPSSSSSSASSSSASPEPQVRPPKFSKQSKEKKGKKTAGAKAAEAAGHGKNEGPDPNWAYSPPEGLSILENTADAGEFDWDTIANDDDLELWLIRVPDSVKPKYLENTKIEVPPSKKSMRTGTLGRKHATFDIWTVGEDDDQDLGGEEIRSLSCLLPRKSKKGKLYMASKPIARHIVLSAQAVMPTPDPSNSGVIEPYKRPARECYPPEVLKHKFMPYGSLSGIPDVPAMVESEMDVDIPVSQLTALSQPPQKKSKRDKTSKEEDGKKAKGRKRKGDSDAPVEKKSKKVKTS
ncbi:hypothetical protein Hypma_013644 [Hypsizygus marmoreus]|uniref:DNA-directed RNA polymerase I subunit RPA34 n=1 Tax=Hypsizygus marmoreus TaxID=39966 RepID=A0A369JCY7_HYPMA|nr:hypothetical protein Hypma_013644 [Hypsizygus marmoreus]